MERIHGEIYRRKACGKLVMPMRKTRPEVRFDLIDLTAVPDSAATGDYNVAFGNLALLRDDIRMGDYVTQGRNDFVLDGTATILPDTVTDVPYWTTRISGPACVFSVDPEIQIKFGSPHTSIGLELYFAGDYPTKVKVAWITPKERIEQIYYPDSLEYFCACNVQNYTMIEIQFMRTRLPYQCVRLNYIKYGHEWTLDSQSIRSALVLEEMDITSATLSINTADVEIVDTNNDFELSMDNGMWRSLQRGQEISIVEHLDDTTVDCGSYFLETWESSKNIVKLHMIDLIGTMDKTNFYAGQIYSSTPAGTIIGAIMASCGIEKYMVDEDVAGTVLSGWLGIQSHRSALQQVVFAAGAVADCSRGDMIKIYRPDRYVSHTIGVDWKFQGTKITLDEYVSGVSVAYVQYTLAAEASEICKSALPAGNTRIEFSDPYLPGSLTVSPGTIREAKTNYIVVALPEAAECTVSGRKYEKIENTYTTSVPVIEAGETEKTETYSGCTLMDAGRAAAVAEYILDYLQLRQTVELRYICQGEAVGNWCNIANAGGRYATTGISSQTLDLTGGYIATATCHGYSTVLTDDTYVGETDTGERGLI